MTLFSRQFLDEHSEGLGVPKYSTANTPNSALKNVGHHDFVFFAIEPRQGEALSAPHKDSSRFGDCCHAVDFGEVPDCAIMTLGDLDTNNAKISLNRLKGVCDENIVNGIKDRFETRTIHQDNKNVEISVRTFDCLSEQIFIKKHVRPALVLSVAKEAATLGIPLDNIDDKTYNTLINSLFVPQVMVPRTFSSTKVTLFKG